MSEETSLLPGVNVLIQGPTGTGKTHSIGTLVESDQNLEVFVEALESGLESLFGYWTDRGLPIPPRLHWHTLSTVPKGSGFDHLIKKAKDIGDMSEDALYKVYDLTKGQRNYFVSLMQQLVDFHDDRTGQKFGSVAKWGPNRALVIDGLTGMSNIAMNFVIGNKPTKSQAEWGRAMDNLEGLLRHLVDACRCHFVLLAHIEREVDEITGGTKIMVSTLGKKLAPKVSPMFSDVILSVRNGKEWKWDTANPQADLKTRNLPVSNNIEPNFSLILHRWSQRGGRIVP